VRLPNDPIAVPVVPQVAANRTVSDDQEVTLGLLCSSVQQRMHIAAINDYFCLGAHILLKLGNLRGGVADERLLPLGKDMGSSRP